MTVRFYRSTDASAPVLRGVAGDLVALLDACLVNGYGAQAAAGWTKAFSGTNKAAYRNSPSLGTGFYLNVDDAAPGTGGAREAMMTGYQTMTALATGGGQFPLNAQLPLGSAPAGATVCRKSSTADTTARPWYLLADETVFYLFVETGDFAVGPIACLSFMFGDFYSMNGALDLYRAMIIGRNNQNTGASANEAMAGITTNLGQGIAGHFVAGTPNGVGSAVFAGKHTDTVKTSPGGSIVNSSGTSSLGSGVNTAYSIPTVGTGTSPMAYPHPVDGAAYMAPLWVHHTAMLRGRLKGIWCPCQTQVFNHGDTFSGTGEQSGKSFLALNLPTPTAGSPVPSAGNIYLEISDTWS